MQVTQIEYRQLELTMRTPFQTAHDVTQTRPLILVAVTIDDQYVGYGEVQAFANHDYAPQNQLDALDWLERVIPTLQPWQGESLTDLLHQLPADGQFARAGIEMAVWDAVGQKEQRPLADMLGAHNETAPVGIALGLQDLGMIDAAKAAGYRRIKLKQDGIALEQLTTVVTQNPDTLFSLDFNASLADTPQNRRYLSTLRDLGIDLIEEPFETGTYAQYNALTTLLAPLKISLDEQLNQLTDVENWLNETLVTAYTLKQGKLGGIQATMQAMRLVTQAHRLAWIGGMLASGLGRAVDAALASQLPQPQYPADISQGTRYFIRDIVIQDLCFQDGTVQVPQQPGIGMTLDWDAIQDQQIGPVRRFNLLQKP